MSYMLAIGGVACTTKTTILKKMENLNGVVVHLVDFKELHDKFKFDTRIGEVLYPAYRIKHFDRCSKDYENVHVFDRHPMESLVYASMRNGLTDEEALHSFEDCQEMGLDEGWKSILLMPERNTENVLTKMMKLRDNKLDTYSNEYVLMQKKRFKMWKNVMNCDEIVMDWKGDITAQQNAIINTITSRLYKWSHPNDGFYTYSYRMPVLKHKVAGFDLNGTLIESVDCFCNSNEWQLKYSTTRTKLIKLLDKDYTIVVFVNYLLTDKNSEMLKQKIERVCKTINLPLFVYIAVGINNYRKPNTKMFEHILSSRPLLDLSKSFYCGDNSNGTNNVDSSFASNCKLKFYYDCDFF
ncbi:nrk1 [Sucra jujuba nucleopolyhedrovirus]|uniref:Nrk1 n=1 Tax=Sucra jujuba nucleopolyhedrovirus TaxID=1563660 RepID=A0A097P936_9ABAC|nr:nrk1 [Sucra jujuba nucleopolyhedrovirus]AIU41333.1 nrk1 [Sucra jujuba nucleopolyhedrovirus]